MSFRLLGSPFWWVMESHHLNDIASANLNQVQVDEPKNLLETQKTPFLSKERCRGVAETEDMVSKKFYGCARVVDGIASTYRCNKTE